MPFTYSIAYGLIAGIISYLVLNTTVWIVEKATGGRIKPADKEYKDPWTYRIEGGILPPWVVRASQGKKDFWRPYEDIEHNMHTHSSGRTMEGKEHASASTRSEVHGALSEGGAARGSMITSSEEGERLKR